MTLPDLEELVLNRPADGLLPPSSATLLREFSVRTGGQRTWPSPQDLLERNQLYGDTRNAAHFAYWLACGRPEQLPEVLQMEEHDRLSMLQDYHLDRQDVVPEEMEALLQRVAAGTRPLQLAADVAQVLTAAEKHTSDWPTWVEDRQQLLHVLGAHVTKMSAVENATGMTILRRANEALPEGRTLDIEVYAQ
jgi:hypothetical protein